MAKSGIKLTYFNGNSDSVKSINLIQSNPKLRGTVRLNTFTGLTSFKGGDNDLEAVTGFSNLTTLKEFSIGGSNTVSFDISSLPINLTTFQMYGLNTTTGDISALPEDLTYYANTGNNTTFGDISALPDRLSHYDNTGSNTTTGDISSLFIGLTYFRNHGDNTTFGNIRTLPANLKSYNNFGFNATIGDIGALPTDLTYFRNVSNFHSLSGDVSDLLRTLTVFDVGQASSTLSKVTGELQNLPSSLTYIRAGGDNTISGDIKDAPRSITTLAITGKNTVSGDIRDIPPGVITFQLGGMNALSGNVENIPNKETINLLFVHGENTLEGSLSSLNNLQFLDIVGQNKIYSYYDGTGISGFNKVVWPQDMLRIRLTPALSSGVPGMPAEHLATLLIDVSGSNWPPTEAGFTYRIFNAGTRMPALNLSDPNYGAPVTAAINELRNKGVTVTVLTAV